MLTSKIRIDQDVVAGIIQQHRIPNESNLHGQPGPQ